MAIMDILKKLRMDQRGKATKQSTIPLKQLREIYFKSLAKRNRHAMINYSNATTTEMLLVLIE